MMWHGWNTLCAIIQREYVNENSRMINEIPAKFEFKERNNMKTMRIFKALSIAMGLILTGAFAFAQEGMDKKHKEMKSLQDENILTYTKFYRLADKYPDMVYEYKYNDGKIEKVIVENVSNEMDRKAIENLILDYKKTQEVMRDIPSTDGIYYAVDAEPEPENGYRELYRTLQSHLNYPEDAKEWGVEGNVYVKFVVDSNGDITHAETVEDIDSDVSRFVSEMEENAKDAVMATSGEWEPAVAHGQEVSSWVVLPVSYQIEPNPALPVFIR